MARSLAASPNECYSAIGFKVRGRAVGRMEIRG